MRDLLQTAKEPVEASTWGSVKAVCRQCATMYFAVYTDVCRFLLCSTSPCTVGLGSPTRCPRCHASLEMVTFAFVYSLCLYIGRFSCHVHYSGLVLSLMNLVSLALSKDHTTVIHTQLYVCIIISLFKL